MEKANLNSEPAKHIRAALLLRGFTLHSFAHMYGYRPSTVYAAARGDRQGVVGSRVRRHLLGVAK